MARVKTVGEGVLYSTLNPLVYLYSGDTDDVIEEITESQLTMKIHPDWFQVNPGTSSNELHHYVIYGEFSKDEESGSLDLSASTITGFEIQDAQGQPVAEFSDMLIKGIEIIELSEKSPDTFWTTTRTWDSDLLYKGNDEIIGGKGEDYIVATGGGIDIINCGGGDDAVNIINSKARLTGGKGVDQFIFGLHHKSRLGRTKSTASTITDFRAKGLGKDQIFVDVEGTKENYYAKQVKVFTGKAGQYRFESGVVMLDTDGNKSADFFLNLFGASTKTLGADAITISVP